MNTSSKLIDSLKNRTLLDYLDRLGLPMLLFIFSYYLVGFYNEVNDDVFIEFAFRGIGWAEPISNLYMWHRITGSIIVFLYNSFPDVPWYGLFLILLNYASFVNIYSILHISLRTLKPSVISIIFVLVFFFVFFESVLLIQYTRTAIFLSGTSALLLLIGDDSIFRTKKAGFRNLLYLSLFLIGLLIRPEGAILSLIFLLPVTLLLFRNRKVSLKKLLFCGAVIILMILSMKTFTMLSKTDAQVVDEMRIPYIMNWNAYADDPPSLSHTKSDTLIYNSIYFGLYSDREKLSAEFLRSLGKTHSVFNLESIDISEITHFLIHLPKLFLKNHLVMAFLNGLLFIRLLVFFVVNRRPHDLASYILLHVFNWAIIIGIACIFKMPSRVLTPLFFLYTTLHFVTWWAFDAWPKLSYKSTWGKLLLLIFFFCLAGYSFRMTKKIEWFKNRKNLNSGQLMWLTKHHEDTFIIFNYSSVALFSGLDALENMTAGSNHIVIWTSWMTWYSYFHEYLETISGSPKTVDFIRFLLTTQPKHIFISSKEDTRAIEHYYKAIYNISFRFKEIDTGLSFKELTYNTQLSFYEIVSSNN